MDFLHRNANNQPLGAGGPNGGGFNHPGGKKGFMGVEQPSWVRIASVVLLFSLTILAVALALLMYFGKDKEAGYVKEKSYQAVFLTNGQVYFGQVSSINDSFVDLRDIYYLNSQNQTTQTENNDEDAAFSLVKLGCELHGPTDQMIINREQVSFWENLKSDGKVADAIKQYQDQNPGEQKCAETPSGTQQQGTNTPPTGTDTENNDTSANQ
ncbi:MAG TPA: hypothetical protein VD735_01000 [Candidatus Saccharimonadales bacterium]|nr:hypothetical protein [Candidatus Saccharimonadales bacterium]